MNRKLSVGALLVLVGCATAARGPRWPWLAASSSAGPPELFGAGTISTAAPEFALSFTPDGKSLFFNRASPDRTALTIMMSTWRGDRWSEPITAPFSGRYKDVDPFVTPDGSRIYFSSDRPLTGTAVRPFKTWYVERTSTGWSDPVDPGAPLNSDSLDIFVSVARDGTMLFSSRRDGRSLIYESRFANGAWMRPRPVSFGTVAEAGNPMISPSGRFAIIVRTDAGRSADLFVSCRGQSGWSEPRALAGGVNSPFGDFAAAVDPMETVLYFTSERPGVRGPLPDSIRPPGDIYRIGIAAAGIDCQ